MRHDLAIVGAGPVGMALALALKDAGLDIVLLDARARGAARTDPRVLALSHGTRLTLERLGVWGRFEATPIETIHVSQQGGLGRTLIEAADYGVPALGHVAAAGALAGALDDALAAAGIPVLEYTEVTALTPGADDITLSLAGGKEAIVARLAACAEGAIRGDREDGVVTREYHQHALICVAEAAAPHGRRAWERFTPQGPLALLPYGRGYAVVHTAAPEEADRLMSLDDAAYLASLQAHFGDRVKLTGVTERGCWPLILRYRPNPAGERTAWMGNAAQTMHPVAGQGFNLALRDVWGLAQAILKRGGDPGASAVLADYAEVRKLDRAGTINFTDSLVRLFSNRSPILKHARGAGLVALDMLPPLRHFVAKRMMFGARAWP
ncbi:MAG: NAD(P)-binding protein [Zoogloea sp.]|nr:NAD(P)-binding protein [Zoogloea sp.]